MLSVDKTHNAYKIYPLRCFKRFLHWVFVNIIWCWSCFCQLLATFFLAYTLIRYLSSAHILFSCIHEACILFFLYILPLFSAWIWEEISIFSFIFKTFSCRRLFRCFDFPLNVHRLCHFAQHIFGLHEIRTIHGASCI